MEYLVSDFLRSGLRSLPGGGRSVTLQVGGQSPANAVKLEEGRMADLLEAPRRLREPARSSDGSTSLTWTPRQPE